MKEKRKQRGQTLVWSKTNRRQPEVGHPTESLETKWGRSQVAFNTYMASPGTPTSSHTWGFVAPNWVELKLKFPLSELKHQPVNTQHIVLTKQGWTRFTLALTAPNTKIQIQCFLAIGSKTILRINWYPKQQQKSKYCCIHSWDSPSSPTPPGVVIKSAVRHCSPLQRSHRWQVSLTPDLTDSHKNLMSPLPTRNCICPEGSQLIGSTLHTGIHGLEMTSIFHWGATEILASTCSCLTCTWNWRIAAAILKI